MITETVQARCILQGSFIIHWLSVHTIPMQCLYCFSRCASDKTVYEFIDLFMHAFNLWRVLCTAGLRVGNKRNANQTRSNTQRRFQIFTLFVHIVLQDFPLNISIKAALQNTLFATMLRKQLFSKASWFRQTRSPRVIELASYDNQAKGTNNPPCIQLLHDRILPRASTMLFVV